MENLNKKQLDWSIVSQDEKDAQKIVRPSLTYWQDVWRRLKSNKTAMIALIVLILMAIAVIIIPSFWWYNYSDQNFEIANQGPTAAHWFGTDNFGRDIFVRCFYGARISLIIGICASLINLVVGVTYGGFAGYVGGKLDNFMMRTVDVLSTVPLTLYVILLMVVMGSGMKTILIAIGTIYWIGMARIVRGQVFSLKEQEYVLAAKTLGAGTGRILFKHLIPNAMGPIIVNLTMSIPSAIFTEAFLSFIGLGIPAPQASLGSLCNDALQSFQIYPHLLFFPAAVLCVMILAFNFLGDGLRDALDPKMRK